MWEVAAEDAVVLAIRREGEEEVQTNPPPACVGVDVIKRVEVERLLLEDLIPGTDESRLRGGVSYFLTDDFLGGSEGRSKTETRDERVSQEVEESEVLSEREGMRRWLDRGRESPGEFFDRLARELTDEEREMLSRLRKNGGNVSGAARELGWTRYRGRKVNEAIEEKAQTIAKRGVQPAINEDFSLH